MPVFQSVQLRTAQEVLVRTTIENLFKSKESETGKKQHARQTAFNEVIEQMRTDAWDRLGNLTEDAIIAKSIRVNGAGSDDNRESTVKLSVRRNSKRKERELPGTTYQLPKRKKKGGPSLYDMKKIQHPGKTPGRLADGWRRHSACADTSLTRLSCER
ncbi:hypothetical protein EVAR_27003_1 [Eumeta japonica]|uniref:Uncharacterized protein n=1 Tax=Eumeta variegata TaxID=151549 RepID=A0A4C1Z2Y9_EUMVA|nr:hypothetical protein EVAR_27003_1 [Eumeta japonica]